MAVDFPSPAVDGQLYPAAGAPPLENGRVYVYDAAAGIWNLVDGFGVSGEFLGRYGDTVDDADAPVIYDWNEPVTFQHGPTDFSKSTVKIESAKIAIESDNDMDVFAPNGDLNISIDGGTLGIGGFQELIFDYDGTKLVGDIKDSTHEKHIVDKKYVDERDAILHNEIIELEEEIDAIAPSVERGVWAFNLGGLASSRGQLSMYDNDYSNVGNPIGIFKQAKSIWLNEEDNAGTPHGFDNVEAGNLLELFVEGEADYGLFEVVDVHDETNGVASWWVIEVNFVRALSDTSLASNGDNIRLKIFSAPSGGTADEFVLKAGDSMTGRLQLERELDKVDFKTPTAITDASISFANTKLNGAKYVASIFQPGADTSLSCSNSFYAKTLYTSNNFYGYYEKTEADGRKTRESKYPRMSFFSDINDPTDRNKDYGVLKFNNSDRLIWNKSGGNIQNDNGMVLEWNSSYGYLWLPKVGNTALTWGKDGVVVFRDSYGSFGTPGQVLTRTTDANYMQWAEPATAGQVLTNWDLVNSNNKNWGNEFYHNALTTGFGGYNSNGAEYNGQSNYGIFISDSMLEKLLKEDYPDKEINIDKWVKYWTGEGTIELNIGSSGASGTSLTRTLTEVKRVNYNNDGRYPGVKLMWADQDSLSFYTRYIKFVKTAGAFEAGEVNTIQVPASNILYYTGSYTPSREEDVNDSTVYWLDRNGNISNSTPSNGAFFPWAWIKENYPWMTGLNIMDGLGVSGIYSASGNAKSLLDPTKTFNSFPAYVNPREFNGVRGIGVWSDNQMASNDRIQLWGLQEAFEY